MVSGLRAMPTDSHLMDNSLGLVYAITHDPDLRLHQEFINLSAFMARLSDHFTLHVACYAGTALSQALERDYQPHSQLLKTLVRGASEFLEHAAPAVYADYLKYNFQPGELLKMGGGEPAVNRWAFWKRRFEEISNQEGVDHITGEVAKRSAQRMDELG